MRTLSVCRVDEAEIFEMLLSLCPAAEQAMAESSRIRCKLKPYQAVALYWMASEFNVDGSRMVEIGTFHGYSASLLAQAAPRAQITTLNSNLAEMEVAQMNLGLYPNVTCLPMASWDYLPAAPDHLDLVFVDGDHKRASRDVPWWERIAYNGLMVWHDYTPKGSPHVAAAVTALLRRVRKSGPDICLVDSAGVGMVGIYKTSYTGWPPMDVKKA